MMTAAGEDTPIQLALDADNFMGETPVWSVAEQALYWVNCEHPPQINRWHPGSGERESWPMQERVGGFVLKQSGGLLVALASGVFDFDPGNSRLELRAPSPLPKFVSLHECQCDRQGRFWVGSIDHRLRDSPVPPEGGALFLLDGDRLVAQVKGISCANGLAFSPDGSVLYLADSPVRWIDRWTLETGSGRTCDRRRFAVIEDGAGFPDGATVDAEGCYWLTLVYHGAIRRYSADGRLLDQLPLPFSNPTKLAFGGPDMRTLFVTTSRMVAKSGAANQGSAWLGGLYQLRTNVAGIEDTPFRG